MVVGVKMHADEADIDEALVGRLVAGQFPEWVGLPIELVASSGTDNAMFRLGTDLTVRMPRMTGAAKDVAAEQKWVPLLAPHLPVAVPTPVACGEPAEGYPYPWTVCRWLPGTNPAVDDLASPEQLATDLAAFIIALRCVGPVDAPLTGRGVPPATRDKSTRAAIAASEGLVDTAAVTAVWDDALPIPVWSGQPAWTHADLSPGNLLVRDGRLTAVIDWGIAGVGDPTVDLIIAWDLLPASARPALREALPADDDTWHRGRGWALSISLIQLPYYQLAQPGRVEGAEHLTWHGRADSAANQERAEEHGQALFDVLGFSSGAGESEQVIVGVSQIAQPPVARIVRIPAGEAASLLAGFDAETVSRREDHWQRHGLTPRSTHVTP